MNLRKFAWLKAVLGVTALTFVAAPAAAQGLFHRSVPNSHRSAPAPCLPEPRYAEPRHAEPRYAEPAPAPTQKPAAAPALPPEVAPQTPSVNPLLSPADLAFAAPMSGAGFSETASIPAQGYIDSAVPLTTFRLRYDSSYDNNRPDRAEFFYAKCGCFRFAPPPAFDPSARGPVLPETSVDYQDISAYLEWAPTQRFSAFIDVPFRFLNPEENRNTNGIGDMFVGFKYAIVADPCQYFTFQFRTAIPTGDSNLGLGTDHVSLEPALLYHRQVTSNVSVFGEVRDWIPIGGTDFAGNVLRYGVGTGYTFSGNGATTVTPVAEVVGWTVLSGREFSPENGIQDAYGDTIVNGKLGVRVGTCNNSLYFGYGRALTGEVWYKDTFRLEFRRTF